MLDDYTRNPFDYTLIILGNDFLTRKELFLTCTPVMVGFLHCLLIGHFLFTLRVKEIQS